MKRLTYYQVHKNKKPKRIKPKKYSESASKIKVYFKVVDKFSKILKQICLNIEKGFKEITLKKLKEGVVISIDSEGGTI